MTRTIPKKASALLAMLLVLVFAVSTFVVSFAEDEKTDSVTQVLYVVQLITGNANPEDVDGVYVIVPTDPASPLPVNEDGKTQTRWTINGNRYEKAYFVFDKSGTHEYTLAKLKDSSVSKADSELTKDDFEEGTYLQPLTHVFGFKIEKNSDSSWTVIPYTCEDPQISVLPEDENGNPKGMSIWNYVNAQKDVPEEPVTKTTEPSKEGCTCKPNSGCNCGSNTSCNCNENKGCSCTTSTTKKGEESSSSTTSSTQSTSVVPVTKEDGEPATKSNGEVKTSIVYVNNNSNNNANGNASSGSNSGSSGSSSTSKGSNVNTGDPHQVGLWVGIIVVSAGALIVIIAIKRKKEKDEENG